jgi:hypothetical protein
VFHFVIITNMKTIRYIAVVCNAIFVAWLLFNAIDEGFRAVNHVELVSMISLIALLLLNIILLLHRRA